MLLGSRRHIFANMHDTFFFFYRTSSVADGHTRDAGIFDTNFMWSYFSSLIPFIRLLSEAQMLRYSWTFFLPLRVQKKCVVMTRATLIYHMTDMHKTHTHLHKSFTHCTVPSCEATGPNFSSTPPQWTLRIVPTQQSHLAINIRTCYITFTDIWDLCLVLFTSRCGKC